MLQQRQDITTASTQVYSIIHYNLILPEEWLSFLNTRRYVSHAPSFYNDIHCSDITTCYLDCMHAQRGVHDQELKLVLILLASERHGAVYEFQYTSAIAPLKITNMYLIQLYIHKYSAQIYNILAVPLTP